MHREIAENIPILELSAAGPMDVEDTIRHSATRHKTPEL